MSKFRVGDRVKVSLPEGAQWQKKTASKHLTAEDVNGALGVVTQHMHHSGQSEYKVQVPELGEFRFWERDLEQAPEEAESDSSSEQA